MWRCGGAVPWKINEMKDWEDDVGQECRQKCEHEGATVERQKRWWHLRHVSANPDLTPFIPPCPVWAGPSRAGPDQELMSQPKGDFCSSRFPTIRYTQGKQEGIRMGPDRHLVCWEISLGRSERLPSPLPAPAHQMWGEGRLLPGLFVFAVGPAASSSPTLTTTTLPSRFKPHAFLIYSTRIFACRHACFLVFGPKSQRQGLLHLCSSPPSPLLLSTILHRSEATSSFCWSVRLRLGRCSWQALLSDKLKSRYGTKACWSSSQYSKLHGTWAGGQEVCNVTSVTLE